MESRISPNGRPNPARSRGFTLIELLIVVAIIAILAAIAVPNFLEAQVRSKVARTQADMRTMATAIEAYHVDNNKYPLPVAIVMPSFAVVYPMPVASHANYDHNFLPGTISTPIAYLSSIPSDVFANSSVTPQPEQSTLYYMSWEYTRDLAAAANQTFNLGQQTRNNAFGAWVMFACGPDRDRKDLAPSQVGATGLILGVYDPTNGTVSNGDIIRTQRNTTGFTL
jgi:prepilin-type N-terminal cleavage/methylation domain-containing protein